MNKLMIAGKILDFPIRSGLKGTDERSIGLGNLAVAVPNLYGTCEAMEKEEVEIPRPSSPKKYGTTDDSFIEDPDGYEIELVERD